MKSGKLIFAASETCADLLYATGFRAPDAFAYVESGKKRAMLLSDLEIDRARSECPGIPAVSLSEIERSLKGKRRPPFGRVLAAFLSAFKVRRLEVPADFPLGLARALKREGIRLRPAKGAFFPQRRIKSPEEIRALTAAARIAESGMARAFEILSASTIRKDRKLMWSRRILSSEILRREIETAILRAGGEARMDSIVACGEQACDPHARGSGPLLAGELLILDLFPRDAATGYHGDITRTVVRGQASDAQRALWELCLEGQRRALAAMAPGTKGGRVQKVIKSFFRESGYPDEIHEGRWRGFFHGLGHGLGLEVHEEPRVAQAVLAAGEVVTVEPGIYWPGVGGVRHEDVVAITEKGCRLLTKHPKPLEL